MPFSVRLFFFKVWKMCEVSSVSQQDMRVVFHDNSYCVSVSDVSFLKLSYVSIDRDLFDDILLGEMY